MTNLKSNLLIVSLALLALALSAVHFNLPQAQGNVVIKGRDYQMVTTRAQRGGDALYIMNRDGYVAVFTWDPAQKGVVVRDVGRIDRLINP